jgi:hypothetical protein
MRTRHLFLSFLAVVLSAILLTSLLPAAAWGDEAQSAVESTDNADANNSAITDSDDADDSTITEDDDNGDPADDPAEVDADVDLDIEDNTSDEEFSFIPTTSATLTMVNQTYEKIVLESYLTNKEKTKETVKPCDIIFVMDQSKWMNTVEDAGASREAIISELHELLTSLAAPTEGEHRVAIAGYGRVNLGAVDPYDADIYPGVTATGNNISFNTGYYTADGFVSQNGWSDLSASQMSGTGLPQMPESYQSNMVFRRFPYGCRSYHHRAARCHRQRKRSGRRPQSHRLHFRQLSPHPEYRLHQREHHSPGSCAGGEQHAQGGGRDDFFLWRLPSVRQDDLRFCPGHGGNL